MGFHCLCDFTRKVHFRVLFQWQYHNESTFWTGKASSRRHRALENTLWSCLGLKCSAVIFLSLAEPLSPTPSRPHPTPQDSPEAARSGPNCKKTPGKKHRAKITGQNTDPLGKRPGKNHRAKITGQKTPGKNHRAKHKPTGQNTGQKSQGKNTGQKSPGKKSPGKNHWAKNHRAKNTGLK